MSLISQASRPHTPLRQLSSLVTESLRAARASSLSSVLILLNLSAAFDTVNHQILLVTLVELCIADCFAALSWFTSYLTKILPFRSYGMAPCPNPALLTLVSLKALYWDPFCPHMDLLVIVEDIVVSPSPTARILCVVLDNQLCCTATTSTLVQSCRFF